MYDIKFLPQVRAKKIKVSEDQEQAWLFQWARRNEKEIPELAWLFAIPNGGHRSKRTAALLKLTGVKRGVPDIFLPLPRNGYHGLWIEMKSLAKSARPSPEQLEWIQYLEAQGYQAVVCHGFESARDTILEYLGASCA